MKFRLLALLVISFGFFLSTTIQVSAAGSTLTGDYRVAQFMDDAVGVTPGGDAVVYDLQLNFDGTENFGHQTLATAGGAIDPPGTIRYDLWAYDQFTTEFLDRGAVSSDGTLLFLGDNDLADNKLMLMVGAKNGTGMGSASLLGDYFAVEIRDENFSGTAAISTSAIRMSADGGGQFTNQTLANSNNTLGAGNVSYSVAPTGVLSLSGVGNGVVSQTGNFFSVAKTDITDNSNAMLVGLKLGSGYSNDQLYGEYVYQEMGRDNGESYSIVGRIYFFGNGAGLYVEEYNSAEFAQIHGFRYAVSEDGMLYIGNDKIGAVGNNGELLLLADTDASDGRINVGIALKTATDINPYNFDNDAMPSMYEGFFGLSYFPGDDMNTDNDGDGISNYLEFLGGTDPSFAASTICPTPTSLTGLDPTVNAAGEILRAVFDSGSGVNNIVSNLSGPLTSGPPSSDSPSINSAGTAVWLEDSYDIVQLISGSTIPTYVGVGDEAVIADSGDVYVLDLDEIYTISGTQLTNTGTWKYSFDANSRGDLVWTERDTGVWKILFQAGGSNAIAEIVVSTESLDYPSINDSGEIVWSQEVNGIFHLFSNVRGVISSTNCFADVNYIQTDLASNGGLVFFINDESHVSSGIYLIAGAVVLDTDGDGIPDSTDNCPAIFNSAQADANSNGTGDACDAGDTDGDGWSDIQEFIAGTNPSLPDTDGDGVIDSIDDNPLVATRWQSPAVTVTWADYSGNITINAVAADIGDEVAIYDPNGVLCGHTIVTVAGSYDTVNVYGDDPATTSVDEGAEAGDLLTFKIWDDSAQVELNVTSVPVAVNWNSTDSLLVDLNGSADVTVTLPLAVGWNLISLPVNTVWYEGAAPTVALPTDNDLVSVTSIANVFSSISGSYTLIRSVDSQGAHTFDPSLPSFFNTLKYVSGGYGYWIKMTSAADLVISGSPALTSSSLQLGTGWNLVGCWGYGVQHVETQPVYAYPYGASYASVTSISDILQSLVGNLQLVRSVDSQGAHTFDPSLPSFFNTLKYMGPGYGYWIKLSTDSTLDFDGIP